MHSVLTRQKIGDALFKGVYFNCDMCSKKNRSSKSDYEKKHRHFCNQYCYSEFRKHKLPKHEHNAFGSGNSLEERAKRRKARATLNHYLRDKHIVRPNCEQCDHKAEAHHDDYDKPLQVRWLCFKHHRAHHKVIRENKELLNG